LSCPRKTNKMSFKKSLILFCSFILFGFGGYFLTRNGFYPIALVNYDFVIEKNVEENSLVAYKYFQNALLLAGSDPGTLDAPQSIMEIKRAALDKLITDALILNELKKRIKEEEFNAIAERNIEKLIENNSDVEGAAQKIYGLKFEDFRRMILMPQAYREILEGRMFLNDENFEKWLDNAKASAWVVILSPKLQWKENSVKF